MRAGSAAHGRTAVPWRWVVVVAAVAFATYPGHAEGQEDGTEDGAWRVGRALDLPGWIDLRGTHRSRYEALDGQFRAGLTRDEVLLAFRTTLRARIGSEKLAFVAELLDARQALADERSPLDPGIVNALEPLQAHLAVRTGDVHVRLGRLTLDLGSRLLVARNNFRNTINAFTGVEGGWTGRSGAEAGAFVLLPVRRRPEGSEALLDNEIRLDRESSDVWFWGVHGSLPWNRAAGRVEGYALALHEQDGADVPSRNRRLFTGGLRLVRTPNPGRFDFDVEAALQLGESRATSSPTDTVDLRHVASFQHVEAGYTFDLPGSPRVGLRFDHATGDGDPDDGEQGRFDRLFGARRSHFGPTGIYGPFAHENLVSPGVGFALRPRPGIRVEAAHRFYWLASATDAWVASGLRDPTGESGRYLGSQPEVAVTWRPPWANVQVEGGVARLFVGSFVEAVPGADRRGDSTYGYVQTSVSF